MDRWRLIKDPPGPGPGNMATDEAVLRSAIRRGGAFTPTLRLYGWSEPTLSVGYLQDAAPFASSGVSVVRRVTGGRAVLHQFELTYSVVAPCSGPFSGGITSAYSVISSCIIDALKETGIEAELSRGSRTSRTAAQKAACFHTPSRFEVLASGRKLVGSSQRRFKDAFLQHGSIIFDLDRDLNVRIFGPEVIERICRVKMFSAVGVEEFRETLVKAMSRGLGAEFTQDDLTPEEEGLKRVLLEHRYQRPEWNLGGGPKGRKTGYMSEIV